MYWNFAQGITAKALGTMAKALGTTAITMGVVIVSRPALCIMLHFRTDAALKSFFFFFQTKILQKVLICAQIKKIIERKDIFLGKLEVLTTNLLIILNL